LKKSKRERLKQKEEDNAAKSVPVAERLLIEELPSFAAERILCTTLGRGQFARMAASWSPQSRVVCHCLDAYDAGQVTDECAAGAGQVTVLCSADFPEEPFDLVSIPVDPRGESELTRDLLQSGYDRLADGGRLMAATSNAEDQWLHDELRKLFDKVTRKPQKSGVFYTATKTGPLKKHKQFECEYAFRDQGKLIKAISRPGVFSHRSLDAGARALLNTMTVRDGNRVLDIGCGSGAVAQGAAVRAAGVSVVAVDSHARAVECTLRGAKLNGLENVAAMLNADGEVPSPGSYDLALGNPPYYSDYRIAEIFLQCALRALKPGGKVLIVAKSHEWYDNRMPELFADVQSQIHKQYTVIEGTKARERVH
jgi:16S rRNA (guanine1207-N2)-methyltransferase